MRVSTAYQDERITIKKYEASRRERTSWGRVAWLPFVDGVEVDVQFRKRDALAEARREVRRA
jgi:hypothetical protein